MHKHKKMFGQNFLNDKKILERIIDETKVDAGEAILEIGPGDGALTEMLLNAGAIVTAVEIDRDLEKVLKGKFETNGNFSLIMKDILTVDIPNEIGGKMRVIANIPYYITSPIINKLLENRENIDEIYIMIQKEVAERITSESGRSQCSVLTMAIRYYAESKMMFTIPASAFTPAPNVDSAFIKIIPRKDRKYESMISEEEYFKYVKAAYASKRKNILNNMANMGHNKNELKELFENNGIDCNLRAEDFDIDDFIKLIQIMKMKR